MSGSAPRIDSIERGDGLVYVGISPEVGGTSPFQVLVENKAHQVLTPNAAITVKLPTTGVIAGDTRRITNMSGNMITIQSSNGDAILVLGSGTIDIVAKQNNPTSASHWTLTNQNIFWQRIVAENGIRASVASPNRAALVGSLAGHGSAGSIVLQAGQSTVITVDDAYTWMVMVNSGSGLGGVFVMHHSSTTVAALNNALSVALTDTGTDVALYKSTGFSFTLKNRSGITQSLKLTVVGANVATVSNPA